MMALKRLPAVALVILTLLVPALAACPQATPEAHVVVPATPIPAEQAVGAYEYAYVLADTGTGRRDQHRIAKIMVDHLGETELDFMIMLGDNFYEEGVTSVDDPGWRTKFEDVYAHPKLDVPVFPTLGNHDHRGSADAQVEYSRTHPRWRMPSRYYAFERTLADGTRVVFCALDTLPIHAEHENAAEQIEWLRSELARSDAHWKIVYGHHPLHSHSHHLGSETMRRAIEGILVENDVDLYLAGHNHILEVLEPKQGVQHVVAGAAAGPDKAHEIAVKEDTRYVATGGGVVLMRLGRDEIALEFIRMRGEVEYTVVVRK